MSIYAVVFPQYICMNNQPNYDNSYVLRRNICACAEQRTDNNKNIATAIKKRPATVLSREAAIGGPVTPQVLSAQCDHRNVLITLIAAVCLQYLWTMRISSYNGLLSKYVHGEDNGQTTYGQRSATNACLAVNAGEQ